MTRKAVAPNSVRSAGAALAPIHDSWFLQVRAFVAPATDIRAGFWPRWAAARFLGDQFGDRFRLEGALADEIEPLLAREAVARLSSTRQEVERIQVKLLEVARRRGVAMVTAGLVERFIDAFGRWCVELELATAHLEPADLSGEARRLLARLRVACDLAA
jgi:hypothetical protein